MTNRLHGNRREGTLAAVAVLLLLAGAGLVWLALREPAGPPAPNQTDVSASSEPAPAPAQGSSFSEFLPSSAPVALTIPSIGVRTTDLVPLGLARDGSIEVPEDPASPGWFRPGPTPGQLGPAVIAGHVDSKAGPAVFYRLGELRPGDRIRVGRENGSIATFVVDRVASYRKQAFPTREVYGATRRAELRLITCGGAYDPETGYQSNTVAFAHLV